MRIVAILAAYNEERFIAACLDNLIRQGLQAYLIDNGSTDSTVAIAEQFLGQGLIDIESFPREGIYSWRPLLERKEQVAHTLEADWFVHVDADEIRLPPPDFSTLAEAFVEVDSQGYNAVNFLEFTFIPTQEAPDHDHPDFQKTMHWYYPFLPSFPHRLNGWKKQPARVELGWSAGHKVRFPGLRMYPQSFQMRHYLCLSIPHAIRKFVGRRYDPAETKLGWSRWRAGLKPEMLILPPQKIMRKYKSDDQLDASNPRSTHYLAEMAGKDKEAQG